MSSKRSEAGGRRPAKWYLSPAALLDAAIAEVPPMRYALGVGGVAAIVAIVLVGWKLEPQHAVFGSLIVLIGMVVLVIFAALARMGGGLLKWPALMLAWAFLVLTVGVAFLFASSAFADWPKTLPCLLDADKCVTVTTRGRRTPADERVINYKDQILGLRGDFEAKDRNPGASQKVRTEGKRLADTILSVNDDVLNPSRRILKYEYAGWALLMVARTQPVGAPGDTLRVERARDALKAFDDALAQMKLVRDSHSKGDRDAGEVFVWMTAASADWDRTLYLKAIALAVLAQAGAPGFTKDSVRTQLALVSPEYLAEYPIIGAPELAWASAI